MATRVPRIAGDVGDGEEATAAARQVHRTASHRLRAAAPGRPPAGDQGRGGTPHRPERNGARPGPYSRRRVRELRHYRIMFVAVGQKGDGQGIGGPIPHPTYPISGMHRIVQPIPTALARSFPPARYILTSPKWTPSGPNTRHLPLPGRTRPEQALASATRRGSRTCHQCTTRSSGPLPCGSAKVCWM